jgi:hypothetical protein
MRVKTRDLRLHEDPVKREIPESVLDQYGGTSLPRAIQMQPMTAEVNKLVNRLGL